MVGRRRGSTSSAICGASPAGATTAAVRRARRSSSAGRRGGRPRKRRSERRALGILGCAGVRCGRATIFVALIASLFGLHYGGAMIFAGSAGTLLWLISLLCLGLWAASAAEGWRSGDRRLILGEGLWLALCAEPPDRKSDGSGKRVSVRLD